MIDSPPADIQTDHLLLIVVGAHLMAEKHDRPIAYRLRDQILRWTDEQDSTPPPLAPPLKPMVCTDVWYMNQDDLMQRPTVSIGGPGVNGATAFIANRVPQAFVLEGTFQVLHDVELTLNWAAAWGTNPKSTTSAVDLFKERYLDTFLRHHNNLPAAPMPDPDA